MFRWIINTYCEEEGEIPKELGNLDKLEFLGLSRNGLSGSIPWEIFNISTLGVLAMSFNEFSGHFYSLSDFDIAELLGDGNSIAITDTSARIGYIAPCKIPRELGNLDKLEIFWSDNNRLSGSVPWEIFNISTLEKLSLEYNNLSDSIPDAFGKLLDVHFLDLSDNNFSRMIPKSLEGLVSMGYFNVSYNILIITGEIPSRGPFANFTYESFMFNDRLCGTPRMHVPPCPGGPANTLYP
nr:probable LRR receptor-like serine/threonine-protein kinase At3g47570 [Ipomoea batatas]